MSLEVITGLFCFSDAPGPWCLWRCCWL